MEKYTQIVERNDSEGETWFWFVEEEENKEFLENLIEKLEEKGITEYFKIGKVNVLLNDILIAKGLTTGFCSGYHNLFNIVISIKKINWEKIKDAEDLIDLLYKGNCFIEYD